MLRACRVLNDSSGQIAMRRPTWRFRRVGSRRHPFIPQYPNHLQVTLDIRYQYAIIASLSRHNSSACPPQLWRSQIPAPSERRVPENHARPPGSPSNFFRILPSHTVTFSPTVHPRKSFSCNTYEFPRKCGSVDIFGTVLVARGSTRRGLRCFLMEQEGRWPRSGSCPLLAWLCKWPRRFCRPTARASVNISLPSRSCWRC